MARQATIQINLFNETDETIDNYLNYIKTVISEIKEEIKELKSLNVPKQGSEKDDSIPRENSVENIVKEPQNKKWWHFGRRM